MLEYLVDLENAVSLIIPVIWKKVMYWQGGLHMNALAGQVLSYPA